MKQDFDPEKIKKEIDRLIRDVNNTASTKKQLEGLKTKPTLLSLIALNTKHVNSLNKIITEFNNLLTTHSSIIMTISTKLKNLYDTLKYYKVYKYITIINSILILILLGFIIF